MKEPPRTNTLDINVDLGEGGENDAELITLAGSVNIACGGHAGNKYTMRAAITEALRRNVAIGAHPGYEDRLHFGRRPLALPAGETRKMLTHQIRQFHTLCAESGAKLHHVKPHGALYNQADQNSDLAKEICASIRDVVVGPVILYGPPSGHLEKESLLFGITFCPEGFVDRRYLADGRLMPRSHPEAVIKNLSEVVAQARELALNHRVAVATGGWLPLRVNTLCIHGDGVEAIEILRAIRSMLQASHSLR